MISGTEFTPDPRRRLSGELRLTHAVLDSRASAAARLLTAAAARTSTGYIDLDGLARLLPLRRSAIVEAIREAEAAGFVHVARPKRRRGQVRYDRPNHFTVLAHANPQRSHYTRLPLLPSLGASAPRWILRAVYEREQARTGAVQIPDSLAGRIAGMDANAVRSARSNWKRAGSLTERRRGTRGRPGIFTLEASPYPVDLARFDADRRKLQTFDFGGCTVTVWGTPHQLGAIHTAVEEADAELASGYADQLEAERGTLAARAILDLCSRSLVGGQFGTRTRFHIAPNRDEAESEDFGRALGEMPVSVNQGHC